MDADLGENASVRASQLLDRLAKVSAFYHDDNPDGFLTKLQALDATAKDHDEWQTRDREYAALDKLLAQLPERLTRQVMVPLGKMAFMPGELRHTNEVTVLLGDRWFAKQTAGQAQRVVGRRREYVQETLQTLSKQRRELEERIELLQHDGSSGGTVEIREDLDGKPLSRPAAVPRPSKAPSSVDERLRELHLGGAPAPVDVRDPQFVRYLDELEREEAGGALADDSDRQGRDSASEAGGATRAKRKSVSFHTTLAQVIGEPASPAPETPAQGPPKAVAERVVERSTQPSSLNARDTEDVLAVRELASALHRQRTAMQGDARRRAAQQPQSRAEMETEELARLATGSAAQVLGGSDSDDDSSGEIGEAAAPPMSRFRAQMLARRG